MGEILRQYFVNPQALLGGALIAVPIIIYLINRQQYRRIPWAAMEFLLRAMKRNRRRIQLQNLLLLLLRTAVILFLVLTAARPVLRNRPLGLGPEKSQNWILALDTSYSMGYASAGRAYFDVARDALLQMFDNVLRPGDKLAIVVFSDTSRVLIAPAPLGDESRARARRELEELTPVARSADLAALLADVNDLGGKFVSSGGEPEPYRVVIFSDFQRRDWLADEGPRDPAVPSLLEEIQRRGGEFAFAQVSYRESPLNLAVTEITATPPLLGQDVWAEFRVSVRNFGLEEAKGIDLTIQVDPDPDDAGREPQLGSVISVPPGGSRTVVMPYRFDASGDHAVVAELRADGLVIDNRRYLALRVEPSVKVLLVDGEPASDPLERETFHLEAALQPGDDALGAASGRFTPFQPQVVAFDGLGDVNLRDHAVVIIANVPEVARDVAENLKRFVADGGSLIVFLGDMVRPEFYNSAFQGEGESLLPLTLGEIQTYGRFPPHLEPSDAGHPLAQYFTERKEFTHLGLIPFSHYYLVSGAADGGTEKAGGSGEAGGAGEAGGTEKAGGSGEGGGTEKAGGSGEASRSGQTGGKAARRRQDLRVAFRYNDRELNPAVFDNAYGKGRVLWMTSSADAEWNEFSKWPDFVVFLYEAMSYLVRFGASTVNLHVGEVFQKRYESSQYASEVLLFVPEGDADPLRKVNTIRKAMRDLPGGAEFEITHEETEIPGLYRLDLLRPNSTEPAAKEYFAVNLDTAESDLRPMTDEDFQAGFAALRYQVYDPSESMRRSAREQEVLRGREFWQACLGAVLLLLLLETALACFFGRRAS